MGTMDSSVGMSMGASGIRAVRTVDGRSFTAEWFPSAGPTPDAEDVAHAIRALVDRRDAPHSLGVAFPDPRYSAGLKAALVEEYVSEVRVISEISGTLEQLRADPDFRYRTVAIYDLGATGLEMTVADIESGTVYATTRSVEMSGDLLDRLVRDYLLTLDILAVPRTEAEESALLEFSREIKEALSTHEATQTTDGAFRLMDRRMFELQIIRPAEQSAIALRDLAEMSEIPPEVVVAVGGGSRIPLMHDVLGRYLRIPVVRPENPELISARGAALYATRVDEAHTPAPTAARRKARSLLTPLLRFGLPTVVALGFLSWMSWPTSDASSTITDTHGTTIGDAAGEVTTTRAEVSSVVTTTSNRPDVAAVPPAPTAVLPGPDPGVETDTPYLPRYDTGGYVAPPPPPPPPPPFQLPRIELPQFQLPPIPRFPFP